MKSARHITKIILNIYGVPEHLQIEKPLSNFKHFAL